MCGPSLVAQAERQAAVDRSRCSRRLSSGSQVRVLPGASSGGRFRSGMSAIAAGDGHVPKGAVEASWKRGGSRRARRELFRHLGGVPSRLASPNPSGCPTPLDHARMRRCRGLRDPVLSDGSRRPEECCVSRKAAVHIGQRPAAASHGKQKLPRPAGYWLSNVAGNVETVQRAVRAWMSMIWTPFWPSSMQTSIGTARSSPALRERQLSYSATDGYRPLAQRRRAVPARSSKSATASNSPSIAP